MHTAADQCAAAEANATHMACRYRSVRQRVLVFDTHRGMYALVYMQADVHMHVLIHVVVARSIARSIVSDYAYVSITAHWQSIWRGHRASLCDVFNVYTSHLYYHF